MSRSLSALVLALVLGSAHAFLRAPATPLAVVTPFFSIWSPCDQLFDCWPSNGPNGAVQGMSGIVRVDGQAARWMGIAGDGPNATVQQQSVQVRPRETVYEFIFNGVALTATFSTPTFQDEALWDLNSRPITYLTLAARSIDNQPHSVQILVDATAEATVKDTTELVTWSRFTIATGDTSVQALVMGKDKQTPLSGTDDLVDWGYLLFAADLAQPGVASVVASSVAVRRQFSATGALPTNDDTPPRAANDQWPVLAVAFDFGTVAEAGAAVTRVLTLAYDELEAVKFFGTPMVPYWRRLGTGVQVVHDMLVNATREYAATMALIQRADVQLLADLRTRGGSRYAEVAAMVFRQAFAGCNMAWTGDKMWLFLKEISSCGCMQTADVIYPMAPIVLYTNPQLLYLMIEPLLSYANNETNVEYNLVWAPHHLGYYPIADLPPSKQENMPIEESANLLIMLAAIAQRTQSTAFVAPRFWPLLKQWADYLVQTSLDPGDQLCTDDFEGPSPHNANLAAKGIIGLGAYAYLVNVSGDRAAAAYYHGVATSYVPQWQAKAADVDGAHTKLEYDLSNTWSLKYNLLWQKVLQLDLFPQSVFDHEEAFYATRFAPRYGVPLDNRADFTKTDWEMWTGAMLSNRTFARVVDSLYAFAQDTQDRVPFSDWVHTTTPSMKGFRCRPVQGGFFAKMIVP